MNAKKVLWVTLVLVLCMGWSLPGWAQQAQCNRSNMLILLDRSHSMKDANKLLDANKAIKALVASLGGAIRFGLLTFCLKNKGPLVIDVEISNHSNTLIGPNLPTTTCYGTPTKNAIDTASAYFTQKLFPQSKAILRETNVLLITDGKPTGASPLDAIKRMFENQNVKTFVVGFGKEVNAKNLDNMADRGGTGKAFLASDAATINKALSDVGKRITAEKCDGIDNDCDGQVDEPWSKAGQSCSDGVGACQQKGTWICNAAQDDVVCSAKAAEPTQELCDGIDNNCDGQIDETWPAQGQECSQGVDACRKTGQWVCNAQGSALECNVTVQEPTEELCDGKDNDCDGEIDEQLVKACSSACGSGVQQCVKAQWTECDAPKPSREVCDGKDNDCDGQVDEVDNRQDLCVEGRSCQQGHCVVRCRNNECPSGFACSQGQCMPKKCQGACTETDTKTDAGGGVEKLKEQTEDKEQGKQDGGGQPADTGSPEPQGLGCSVQTQGVGVRWSWSWVWLGLFLGLGRLRRRNNR